MNVLSVPFVIILALLLVFSTLTSRFFAILSALIANGCGWLLVKINSDKFSIFIFNFLSCCELTGKINRKKTGENDEKKI